MRIRGVSDDGERISFNNDFSLRLPDKAIYWNQEHPELEISDQKIAALGYCEDRPLRYRSGIFSMSDDEWNDAVCATISKIDFDYSDDEFNDFMKNKAENMLYSFDSFNISEVKILKKRSDYIAMRASAGMGISAQIGDFNLGNYSIQYYLVIIITRKAAYNALFYGFDNVYRFFDRVFSSVEVPQPITSSTNRSSFNSSNYSSSNISNNSISGSSSEHNNNSNNSNRTSFAANTPKQTNTTPVQKSNPPSIPKKLEQFFLIRTQREQATPLFIRINGYNDGIECFVKKYKETASQNGTVIVDRIPNPDTVQIQQYRDIFGNDFELSQKYLDAKLRKWAPTMNGVARSRFVDGLYEIFSDMKSNGKPDSVIQSTCIKMVCWLHFSFIKTAENLGKSDLPKILYVGSISKHEFEFIRVIHSIGADVVLLQPGGDSNYLTIDPESKHSEKYEEQEIKDFINKQYGFDWLKK